MKTSPLEAWIARLVTADSDGSAAFDRAALERYQLRRLRETLRLARTHSAFYRRRLAGAPAELDTLEDLKDLPLTTADDIRADPLGFVCVSQDEIDRVVTLDSSGTTGAPKRVLLHPCRPGSDGRLLRGRYVDLHRGPAIEC